VVSRITARIGNVTGIPPHADEEAATLSVARPWCKPWQQDEAARTGQLPASCWPLIYDDEVRLASRYKGKGGYGDFGSVQNLHQCVLAWWGWALLPTTHSCTAAGARTELVSVSARDCRAPLAARVHHSYSSQRVHTRAQKRMRALRLNTLVARVRLASLCCHSAQRSLFQPRACGDGDRVRT
jgi:hypothetical protein